MLKKIVSKVAKNARIVKVALASAVLSVFGAAQAFAASPPPNTATSNNADLDTAANKLIGGVGDMKTDALVIIAVCIVVFVAIFGIGWLIRLVKKKMSAAS